jgi:hypothetical protein
MPSLGVKYAGLPQRGQSMRVVSSGNSVTPAS